MKFISAFDSFKGCLSAADACHAAAQGLLSSYPDAEVLELPLSDGGEGLVNCVRQRLTVHTVTITAHGPQMEPLQATYVLSADGQTAYMEMAATSGLPLVPQAQRDPTRTTTYGVGDMIADAIGRGCTQIVMGIGGSATNDGGQGMIRALQDRGMIGTGRDYGRIIDPRLQQCQIRVACDVSNPLCGPMGASHIFGPQKGATPQQVLWLDEQLRQFAQRTVDVGIATPELQDQPGTGAAGGLGYGLMAYLNAELHSGIDIMLDLLHFDQQIAGATLVLTGEGCSDPQTLMGKVPHGVWRRCQAQDIPVALLSGAIHDPEGTLARHFQIVQSINADDPRSLDLLMLPEVARENLRHTASQLRVF